MIDYPISSSLSSACIDLIIDESRLFLIPELVNDLILSCSLTCFGQRSLEFSWMKDGVYLDVGNVTVTFMNMSL